MAVILAARFFARFAYTTSGVTGYHAMTNSAAPFTLFTSRPIQFLDVLEIRGHRIKMYEIAYGGSPLKQSVFEPGISMAMDELPQPGHDVGRPGLGFVICHQGGTGDYIILCWWDRENELPIRIFVRDQGWRPACGSESVCVWDLEVIWHERCAYVETMLTPGVEAPVEAYCNRGLRT